MADKKPARKTLYSPKGAWVWPRLTQPDTKFNADGEYKVDLRLDGGDAAAVKLIEAIDAAAEGALEEARQALTEKVEKARGKQKVSAREALNDLKRYTPYESDYDDDGSETGDVIFRFKVKAKGKDNKTGETWANKVVIYDAAGQPIPPAKAKKLKIGSGTVGRVAYQILPFFNEALAEAGVSLRLKGVQIIKLVEWGSGGLEFGADEDGGFSVADMEDDGDEGFGDETEDEGESADDADDGEEDF